MKDNKRKQIVVIGAGPAGLACAHEILKRKENNIKLVVIEKSNNIGGLSKTTKYKNHYFDVGPHRFYTKNNEVFKYWKDLLGKDFKKVKRLTSILYKNKKFLYPVDIIDVLKKLGIKESFESVLSFIYSKLTLTKLEPKTFEDWIVKNFGKKLYLIFFKTYTEKIWGIPCNQIGAEWAAQRIKNLNFVETIKTYLFGQKKRKVKTLVNEFYYPLKGAGLMYQEISRRIKKLGGKILLDSEVDRIFHDEKKIKGVSFRKGKKNIKIKVNHLFSSMPLTYFILSLEPQPNKEILESVKKLYFRDHITVDLISKKKDLFPDNWIYIHSPELKMARVTNYNNFSKNMSSKGSSALSVEYFSFKNDELWKMDDDLLVELAKDELEKAGLVKKRYILDGFVVRETESYPTYYLGYKSHFNRLKNYVSKFKNLSLVGRGGMYRYNNMDHSIYSGMLAGRNYCSGKNKYDLWSIKEDAEYLEIKKQ
jgi:protoporphyrinogen oxidase